MERHRKSIPIFAQTPNLCFWLLFSRRLEAISASRKYCYLQTRNASEDAYNDPLLTTTSTHVNEQLRQRLQQRTSELQLLQVVID